MMTMSTRGGQSDLFFRKMSRNRRRIKFLSTALRKFFCRDLQGSTFGALANSRRSETCLRSHNAYASAGGICTGHVAGPCDAKMLQGARFWL